MRIDYRSAAMTQIARPSTSTHAFASAARPSASIRADGGPKLDIDLYSTPVAAGDAGRGSLGVAAATTSSVPGVGPVIGAILQAIAAMVVMLGQLGGSGKEQEAGAKEHAAGTRENRLLWAASSLTPGSAWDDKD